MAAFPVSVSTTIMTGLVEKLKDGARHVAVSAFPNFRKLAFGKGDRPPEVVRGACAALERKKT